MSISIILAVLGGIVLSWNIFMLGVTVGQYQVELNESITDDSKFFKVWDSKVADEQDTVVGRALMKTFYFMPTIASFLSKCMFLVKLAHNQGAH